MRLPTDLPLLSLLLRLTCVLHLALALVYALLQQRYAARYTRSPVNVADRGRDLLFLPSVDVLVPCFNEQPDLLEACLTSLANQDYRGQLEVFVVDDSSGNLDDRTAPLRPVLERHGRRPGWRVILLDVNVGKRCAMDAALWLGKGDVVVTMDSDTVLASPDAISQIAQPFADRRVGAVSANLRALNAEENLLTYLVNRSYWVLFEFERAAQSHFRTVLCCQGGFVAYQRTALEAVWGRHLNQTFRGRACRTGDDLHLTLELLAGGYDAVLQPHAKALTRVPDNLRTFFRQQLRWSRSFVRELRWALPAIAGRRHIYVVFDLTVQVVTPVLKAAVVLLCLTEAAMLAPTWLDTGVPDIGFVVVECALAAATLLSTSTLGALQARDLAYVLFGPVYLGLILPAWVLALIDPGRDSWRTRELTPTRGAQRCQQHRDRC